MKGDFLKRLFSVILIMLLFTGCNSTKSNVKPINRGITFSCDVKYYNEAYECVGSINDDGETEVEFLSPKEIKGLKFTFADGSATANFQDIEYTSQKIVFENSVATLIYDVLSSAKGEAKEQDDVFFVEGVTKDFDYRLELGATGLPIKITTRPDAAEVVFKNVKIENT